MTEQILILGGGYAGVYAALGAARSWGCERQDRAGVRGAGFSEPATPLRARPGRAPALSPMLERIGATFRLGRVIRIDVGARGLILADGATLPWDRLVIALGSQTGRPSMPGIERAFDVGSYDGALAFNRHLKTLPAGATTTVIGSGFTGLELATELAERYRVVLIERADVIAPGFGEGPRKTITRALNALGVEVRRGTTLDRIDGETMVWCGGMVAHPLTRTWRAERDVLGRLVTEPSLAVRGMRNVYAAGDVALAMADDEHPALMSCQHAIKLGQFAGHNAMNELLGRPTVPYRQPAYRMCLDLGRAGAVITEGWEYKVLKSSMEAKAHKREINRVWAALPTATDREALLAFGEQGTSKYRDAPKT
jgi:NADH:quinone reductase (non-electrogenic)